MKFTWLGSWHHQTGETDHSASMDHARRDHRISSPESGLCNCTSLGLSISYVVQLANLSKSPPCWAWEHKLFCILTDCWVSNVQAYCLCWISHGFKTEMASSHSMDKRLTIKGKITQICTRLLTQRNNFKVTKKVLYDEVWLYIIHKVWLTFLYFSDENVADFRTNLDCVRK